MGKSYANFMCKKFFHPASYDNIKRVWMAQQRTEAETSRQEALRAEYERDQETYNNRQIMGDEKVKHGLTFIYEPPKGFKSEEKEKGPDGEPEYKFEWQRVAPREGYAKNMDVTDQPFGIAVRKVKCVRCHNWGHVNTDRECPMFNSSRDEPISGPSTDKSELIAGMRENGLVLKQNAMDRKVDRGASNQQIIPSDDEGEIPEAAFLQTLSTKDKKKLLKKLKEMEKPSEMRKKSKKKRKRGSSEDDSSDDSSDEEEHRRRKKKKKGHKSMDHSKGSERDKKGKRKQRKDERSKMVKKYSDSESGSESDSSEDEIRGRKEKTSERKKNSHKRRAREESESDSENERRHSKVKSKGRGKSDDGKKGKKHSKYDSEDSDNHKQKPGRDRKRRKELSDGRTDTSDETSADERYRKSRRDERTRQNSGRDIKQEGRDRNDRERSRERDHHGTRSSRRENRPSDGSEKRYRRGRSSSADELEGRHRGQGERSGRKVAVKEERTKSLERRHRHRRDT